MGEAKRRGSLSDRVAQAKQAQEDADPLPKGFQAAVTQPVDVEKFVYLFDVFNNAVAGKIPGIDPTEKKVDIAGVGTVAFTNTPLNRGLDAITTELRSMGLDEPGDKIPYIARFCEIYHVFSIDRFSRFLLERDDTVSVPLAFVKALATARFNSRPPSQGESEGVMGYDLDDLYAKAEAEFAALSGA